MPIASQMRIATSTDTRSCSAGEPALERRQPELVVCEAPRRGCRHVVGGGRSVDERREVRADRRRQLRGIAEIRRYVGEVLDRIRVVALSEEGPRHPVAISGKSPQRVTALAHRLAQVRELLIFVGTVSGFVPADVMEELVTCGELDLGETLIGFDAGGELDLVAVGVEAAACASVETDDAAPFAEPAHVRGKAAQRATREIVTGRHIDVAPLRPPSLPECRQLARGQSLRAFELGTIAADEKAHRLSLDAYTPATCV